MKVQTISPEEPGYKDIDNKVLEHLGQRVDYGLLASRYNAAEKNTILLLKLSPHLRIGNIAKVLLGRGLKRKEDYEITRLKRDTNEVPIPVDLRPVAIKKLTEAMMSTPASKD